MSVLSDKSIIALCSGENPMIKPFVPKTVRKKHGKPILSYGLGPEGYDVRLKSNGQLANKNYSGVLSVSKPDKSAFVDVLADKNGLMVIPGQSLLLIHTLEYFKLPNDVLMAVFTKSKFARCGISLNTTKAVPGWEGNLLIEIQNNMPFPVSFNCDEGVATMVFYRLDGNSQKYKGQFLAENNLAVSNAS